MFEFAEISNSQYSVIYLSGKYVAGAHHLQLVKYNFSKDQHALREQDIDCKDKQNFEAVQRITSNSVLSLLAQIPDAAGTLCYLKLIRAITDSFLDKHLNPLDRIEKIWYAVFFIRYWRKWLLTNPCYNLKNCVTQNAYVGIELNAHTLIIFLRTIHIFPGSDALFRPWCLGSQSYERSMTSTFLTVINFGMLGLLRRLHRIDIKLRLQAESAQNNIKYTHSKEHKSKEKHSFS